MEMIHPPYWLTSQAVDLIDADEYKVLHGEFMDALADEETRIAPPIPLHSTMRQGLERGTFWVSLARTRTSPTALFQIFHDHIKPMFSKAHEVAAQVLAEVAPRNYTRCLAIVIACRHDYKGGVDFLDRPLNCVHPDSKEQKTMPEIKFFFASGACSLCPHILLHEVTADFQPVQVVNNGPEVKFSEDFYRINPKMRVPVIAVDQEVITELPAVATVISSLAPEKGLMGKNTLDTVRVYEWMNYLSGTLHAGAFGHLFRPDRWTTATNPTNLEAVKIKARERVTECFQHIEGKLQGLHAVGNSFTAVDPFLYVFYRWGTMIGEDMSVYPKYDALVRNLEARPAVQTALEKEKLPLVIPQ